MEDVRALLAGEGALRASRAPPVQTRSEHYITFNNWPRMNLCRKSLASKTISRPCPASIGKIAADDPAIMLAEDLPVAAVLGIVTVCVQVTRHGRPRA
jgi:hypothetical protein